MDETAKKSGFSSGFCLPLFYSEKELLNTEQNEYYRLVLVEKGSGFVHFNGEKRLMVPPAIFCLNETDRVTISAISGWVAESIAFHPRIVNQNLNYIRIKEKPTDSITERLDFDSLRPFIKRDKEHSGQYHVGPATFQHLKQLVRSIGDQLHNPSDKFWPCRSRTSLLEILFFLFRLSIDGNRLDELPIKGESGWADQVILYLVRNYRQKITIEELTKTFNLNRNTLYQIFHEATGLPLITYLIKLRVKMAAVLLRETSLPVTEIMEQVGFSDLTHFGRVFKKETGSAPSEYRTLHKPSV